MTSSPSTTATTIATTTTEPPYVPVAPFTAVVSAWSPGGLDPEFTAAVATLPGVVAATVVRGDRLMLASPTVPAGMGIPLDALAIDPATYVPFVAAEAQEPLARLGPGEAVLGQTSAGLRGVGAGGRLTFLDGTSLEVVAVLPDAAVAGAEVVVAVGAVAAVDTERFVLVAHDGDVQAVAGQLRDAYPADRPLRVRQPGEVPYLRHGDGVLTEADVKVRFGEFAFTEGPTRDFAAYDPAWADAVVRSMPMAIVGTVECHVDVLPAVAAALRDIDELQQQLVAEQPTTTTTTIAPDPTAPSTEPPPPAPAPLLDVGANLGCFNPRLIRPGEGVSRHAYGIAIDLAPPVATGVHDPRVVAIFEAHGFTWGGDFLATDPIHFEWTG